MLDCDITDVFQAAGGLIQACIKLTCIHTARRRLIDDNRHAAEIFALRTDIGPTPKWVRNYLTELQDCLEHLRVLFLQRG
ncbi:hypothetical protein Rmet_3355 [Cupriavidus metallidurans CH34]|uniref:Uncharacterized protein n=1 Tax=Cupriavidus metallidurans (strain ATCC 43123 / DSM 2839 / NBRC 102507 / CH34) TaxID=266264 RepID=Q1LHZ9_CUPMC|nr:hypothetical protein Rmet_3355 [Cupriavidus metallidurans CH34]